MTRKLNNDNGLQDRKTEHQAVTGGIFYCRDSAGFSVSAFNKLSCNLTGQCFEIGNKNIPPKRYFDLCRNGFDCGYRIKNSYINKILT